MADKEYLIEGHYYQYDLQWLIDKLLEFENSIKTIVDLQTIHYANPIQWNITTQYAPNTVVVDPNNGTAYMSAQAVPTGILLSNEDYWVVIFNYQKIYNKIMSGVAFNDNDNQTASVDRQVNDLVWFQGDLYRCTRTIMEGSQYIVGTNITPTTIESLLANYYGRDRTAQIMNDTINVSGDYTLNAGDIAETSTNRTEKITGDREVDIDGTDSLHVDGVTTINRGGAVTEVYGSSRDTRVTGTATTEYDDTVTETYKGKRIVTLNNATVTLHDDTLPVSFSDKTVDLHDVQKLTVAFADSNGCVGNGVTDDTVALQTLLDSYDIVVLSADKTYLVTSLKVHKTLDGGGGTIKLSSASPTVAVEPDSNAHIQHLNIDATESLATYTTLCYQKDNVMYDDVHITSPNGLSFGASNATNIIYRDCSVTGSKTQSGFWCYGDNQQTMSIKYIRCRASHNWLDGFNLTGYGIKCIDCLADYNGQKNPDESALGASGFYLDHQTSARDVVFTNCIAHHNTERGLSIEALSQKVIVSDCEFYYNQLSGIHVATAQRVNIHNCICHSNGTWSSAATTSYRKSGIDLDAPLAVVITGCTCYDEHSSGNQTQEYGIEQYGTANIVSGVIACNACGYNKIESYKLDSSKLTGCVYDGLNAPTA